VLYKHFERGKPSGWSNGPQAKPFHGKRSALIEYHDDMVVPELERRGMNHRSPIKPHLFPAYPGPEWGHKFWDCVTWREVLRDIRHLFEKHRNDVAAVAIARRDRRKTRIVIPTGHSEEAMYLIMERAICKVFDLESADYEVNVVMRRLMNERLLDPRVAA
jgi:hypothetical protein